MATLVREISLDDIQDLLLRIREQEIKRADMVDDFKTILEDMKEHGAHKSYADKAALFGKMHDFMQIYLAQITVYNGKQEDMLEQMIDECFEEELAT